MKGAELIDTGQIRTKPFAFAVTELDDFLGNVDEHADVIVEDYRVYGWESEKHKWASLHTPQLIGAIRSICISKNLGDPKLRMAVVAKKFVTDEKLTEWGMYKKSMRHARDAIRHAVYSQIFDK